MTADHPEFPIEGLRAMPVDTPPFALVQRRQFRRRVTTASVIVSLVLLATGGWVAVRSGHHALRIDTNPDPSLPTPSVPSTSTAPTGTSDSAPAPIVIGTDLSDPTLDPSYSITSTYLAAVYETLVSLDPTDNKTLRPRLARSWTSNADATQYTFTLDPGATFSDGTRVTSADVAFSWKRRAFGPSFDTNPSVDNPALDVARVDTPNPATAIAVLKHSDTEFAERTSSSLMAIMNSTLAQTNGASLRGLRTGLAWFDTNSAGSGPFTLDSAVKGKEVRLKRNDRYWGRPAVASAITLRDVGQADPATEAKLISSGELDVALDLTPDAVRSISDPTVITSSTPGPGIVYLQLSPRDDQRNGAKLTPEVRRALRLAIDYDGIANLVGGGAGKARASLLLAGQPGADRLPPPTQDLVTSRALLAASSIISLDLDARFPISSALGTDSRVLMTKIKTDLASVGVNLNLVPVAVASLQEQTITPVALGYWTPNATDVGESFKYLSLGPNTVTHVLSNVAANNAEKDLMAQALATSDPAARADLYGQLDQLVLDDQVVIPLLNPVVRIASRSNISGAVYSVTEGLVLSTLTRT